MTRKPKVVCQEVKIVKPSETSETKQNLAKRSKKPGLCKVGFETNIVKVAYGISRL